MRTRISPQSAGLPLLWAGSELNSWIFIIPVKYVFMMFLSFYGRKKRYLRKSNSLHVTLTTQMRNAHPHSFSNQWPQFGTETLWDSRCLLCRTYGWCRWVLEYEWSIWYSTKGHELLVLLNCLKWLRFYGLIGHVYILYFIFFSGSTSYAASAGWTDWRYFAGK